MPFTYPTTAETRLIEPELVARGRAGRVGLDLLPPAAQNTWKVRWRQRDSSGGLQNMRGLDGQPTRVLRIGENMYEYEPGVFGEFVEITETELSTRAENLDVLTTNISVDDLMLEADEVLIGREYDRMEASNWSLLLDGVLQITIDGPNGLQQVYRDSYPIQTYTSPVSVSDQVNSTPSRYFQSMAQLGEPSGISVNFGAGARFICNSVTANAIVGNLNASDIFGRRVQGGNTVNDLNSVNTIMGGMGLPKIEVYDQGYLTAPRAKGGRFKKWIPDYRGVLIGQRPGGVALGNYQVVRNPSAGYRPVSYAYTIDRANGTNGEKRTPPTIERHRGHNGGPALWYPSAIISVYL